MKTSLRGLNFIKGFEKLRLVGYLPTKFDVPTAGWGHTGPGVHVGVNYTLEQCQNWFDYDISIREAAVYSLVKVELTQGQYDALVSFIFNVGITNFSKSTMRKKLNAGDYAGAANEFVRWNKQKGRVLDGLTNRRLEEKEMFLHG